MTDANTRDRETGRHRLACEAVDVVMSGRHILKAVSVTIMPGEMVVVVGANGAGKSTLLKLLAGLLQPDVGTVTVDGTAMPEIDRRARGRRIAYLPQDRQVHWQMRVKDVVTLGRIPHRGFAAATSRRDDLAVQQAVERMSLEPLLERHIDTLSGGERGRVLLARALAQQACYIIADEPTAGLDPAHALHVFAEFQRLSRQGSSVVVAAHDLSLAARFADRVVVLKDGACLKVGHAAEVLSTDTLERAFGVASIITTIDGVPVVLPTHPLPSD